MLLPERRRLELVPVLDRLQGRLAAQGAFGELLVVEPDMAVPRGLQLFARSEVVGLQHRLDAAVESLNHADGPLANAWAAGEIMVGALHGQGDLAGFGMTIGTVFGRIAGREAAAFLR